MTLGDAVQRAEACFGAGRGVTVKESLAALGATRQVAGDDTGLVAVLSHRAGREFPTPLTDDARLEGMAAAEASGARDVMVLGQLLGVCSLAVSEGGFDIRPYFVTEAVGPQHPASDSDVVRVDAWLRDADLVANAVARDVAFNVALGWAVDFDLVDKGQEWLNVWQSHDGVSDWHLLYYGVLLGVVNPGDVQEELFAAAGDCADRVLLSVAALVDAYRACGECGLALALVPVAERNVGGVVVVESLQRVMNAYGPLVGSKAMHNFVLVKLASLCVQRAIEFGPGQGARVFGVSGSLLEAAAGTRFVGLVGEGLVRSSPVADDLCQAWMAEVHGTMSNTLAKIGDHVGACKHSQQGAALGFGNAGSWFTEARRLFGTEPQDGEGAIKALRRCFDYMWAEGRCIDALELVDYELEYVHLVQGPDACQKALGLWHKRTQELHDRGLPDWAEMYWAYIQAHPHRYKRDYRGGLVHARDMLACAERIGSPLYCVKARLLMAKLLELDGDYETQVEVCEAGVPMLESVPRELVVDFVKRLAVGYEEVGRVADADAIDEKYEIQY